MRFLFLSETGDGLGLALRLKERGHTVGVSIKDRRCKANYDGLLYKPSDWSGEFLTKDTIVVFDSNGGGKTGDRLRAQGYAVFVGSTIADQLEYDRDVAFEYMSQVGIKLPNYETFHDWQSARDFVKRNDEKWVFKPSGKLVKDVAIKSYVASDAEDMIRMLDYYESIANKPPDFELQEFHEGVAISTEGWFNGECFMRPFNHTVERKQIMNDNLGPSGGCSGNLVWAWRTGTNHVIEEGILKLEPVLREYGYVGPIDLNAIVNTEGVWALELTPRFGFDALPAFLEVLDEDPAELIASLARLEHPQTLRMKDGFGSALRVNVPPYPSEQFAHAGGVPIRGFDAEDRPHLFFYDVELNEKTQLVTSPAFGAVVAITGYGNTPTSAFQGPYRLAKQAKIPDKMYRTDLEAVLQGDLARFERQVQIREKGYPPVMNPEGEEAPALSQ